MKNCDDEDYAYGTEKQKQIDAEFLSEEDDFPGWPIALGLMLFAMLACWGLFHLMLWLGSVR